MDTSIKKLYAERLNRITTAVSLGEPDQIPICPAIGTYPLMMAGLTVEEVMIDYRKSEAAMDMYFDKFPADLVWNPSLAYWPAKLLSTVGINWLKWPGNGVSNPNSNIQYIESDYMKAEDYPDFISDPTHFMQTKWLPRSFSKLQGLAHLNLRDSAWAGFLGSFGAFGNKELQDSLATLIDASKQLEDWGSYLAYYNDKLVNQYGFPLANNSGYAPFDMLGDSLRGTVEILEDMYDRPELLLKALDAMLPISIECALNNVKSTGQPYIWIWLHKGVDQFMSSENYDKFYWNTLQKYIHALIDNGITPIVYCEGTYNTRLERLREVPRGKVVYSFEYVDMKKAKQVLGDTACIMGNVPNTMLEYGTAAEVKNYCRQLFDDCAPGGGFILDTSAVLDNAREENFATMFESAANYGKY